MSKTIDGTFSLRQLVENTYKTKFRTRFKYKVRDVLKKVIIIKETTLNPDSKSSPTITYVFKSFSYPSYGVYLKHTSANKQRKYKHQYDQVLSIVADDNGKFSMDSTDWKYRLGSQKKWQDNVPQSKVKTIYRETLARWREEYEKECNAIKRRFAGEQKTKKLLEAKKKFDKRKEQHRRTAPYLDKGDFNSRVRGINGDFSFRAQSAFAYWGHLYGRNSENYSQDPENMFAPKHMLALIDFLIKIGILV